MSDDAATPPELPAADPQPTVEQSALTEPPVVNGVAPAPAPAPAAAVPPPSLTEERPELLVGAAFAGGIVLALFLKRLVR